MIMSVFYNMSEKLPYVYVGRFSSLDLFDFDKKNSITTNDMYLLIQARYSG